MINEFKGITRDQLTAAVKKAIISFLLKQKVSPYAHHTKTYRRLANDRSSMRKILKFADPEKLLWNCIDVSHFSLIPGDNVILAVPSEESRHKRDKYVTYIIKALLGYRFPERFKDEADD